MIHSIKFKSMAGYRIIISKKSRPSRPRSSTLDFIRLSHPILTAQQDFTIATHHRHQSHTTVDYKHRQLNINKHLHLSSSAFGRTHRAETESRRTFIITKRHTSWAHSTHCLRQSYTSPHFVGSGTKGKEKTDLSPLRPPKDQSVKLLQTDARINTNESVVVPDRRLSSYSPHHHHFHHITKVNRNARSHCHL